MSKHLSPGSQWRLPAFQGAEKLAGDFVLSPNSQDDQQESNLLKEYEGAENQTCCEVADGQRENGVQD